MFANKPHNIFSVFGGINILYKTHISIIPINSSAFSHNHWALPFLGLHRIKKDDKLIKAEGVESLSEAELRQACRYRGMLQLGSVEEMRQQVIARLYCIIQSSLELVVNIVYSS